MRLPRRRFLQLAGGAAALPTLPRIARADGYPTRPVRWIVCFAAGGPNDTTARLIAGYLSETLGQQVFVENHTGAGGNVGMEVALNAPADGYTIAFVAPNNAISATLYQNLPFDFIRDSVPIAGTMQLTNVLVTNPTLPVKSLAEFIAYAKANPGKINFGSGGVGTSPHLSGELLKAMAGINMLHVPYRGSAPAAVDLLAGQLQAMFDNLPGQIGNIKAGKVRALGVTAAKRAPELPDVPAIGEIVPGYEASVWYGISGPKAIPTEIVGKLNHAVNNALANPQLQARMAQLTGKPMPMTPAQFGELVASETAKWAKVIKEAGIKAA
ncbi:MAG TPA: tripartite tricarboxylate transporter substrate binding protein [Xanthobacteraceae bacterium]|nr:tripartite tricarboxylate transporter substrate binding protein [Xanthobacteraceae bacterium]